jgi:hypothetical protein
MTDRLRVTLIFEYDLPDGQERQDAYDTMDPDECAAIDAANINDDVFLGVSAEDFVSVAVESVKDEVRE